MRIIGIAAAAATLLCSASAQALAVPVASSVAPGAFDDQQWHQYTVSAHAFTRAPAPADEYFGRFKLSNLGMRNIIHDMKIEGDSPLALPLQQGRIREVAGALSDWANRYPRDKWLPGTASSFVRFLERKSTPETAAIATAFTCYLIDRNAGKPSAKWYAALSSEHVPVADIDLSDAPSPFPIYGALDPELLRLAARVPKP